MLILEFMKGAMLIVPALLIPNLLVYYVFFAFLYFVCKNKGLPVIISSVFWYGVGLANTIVIQFRGNPISPTDITAISTATQVVDAYKFTVTLQFLSMTLLFLILLVVGIKCWKKKTNFAKKKRWLLSALAVVMSIVIVSYSKIAM